MKAMKMNIILQQYEWRNLLRLICNIANSCVELVNVEACRYQLSYRDILIVNECV